MQKLLTLRYYFDSAPGAKFEYWLFLVIFAGALFFLAAAITTYRQKTGDKILRKMVRTYPSKLIWFGAVALFLVWVRSENIKLLAMRFWWVVYFAILIFVIINNIRIFYRDYPRKVRQSLEHHEENKYLPTKKKKKK